MESYEFGELCATNEDYRLLSCTIRSLQIQREELRNAVAQRNAELDEARDTIEGLEEELDLAKEQLRLRGVGIPFNTPNRGEPRREDAHVVAL